ncbi:MAG: calcineurin phosphoesterase [Lysobacteraceae bacterium]|nr:MAG: calcineurin phosphoesterase [Xanthomonadaceae bacterium]
MTVRRNAAALCVGMVIASISVTAFTLEPVPFQVSGRVYQDRDGDGRRDAGEPGVSGVVVSNGRALTRTGRDGGYRIDVRPGQTLFVVKPAGWRLVRDPATLPRFWLHASPDPTPVLKYGGIPQVPTLRRFDLGLQRESPARALDVRIFGDPQVKSIEDVGYYGRDIVDSVLAERARPDVGRPQLGLSLSDIADDVLSLYPALNAQTVRMGIPWLHVAGNHDLDFDAVRDEDSLLSFRNAYGPDTFAWEEAQAVFIGLDDVIYRPGQRPAYIGGFRDDQFAFLEAYLPGVPKDRLLVLAMHIPLFEPDGRDTFRDADRERLFALLRDYPRVLILSAHSHTQQHRMHDARSGWHGARPLHEYNVGAACGAFWSGVKDTAGIPDATMADGTPNGYASLRIAADGDYALAWHPARDTQDTRIGLHAPRVLRRGAYPAWSVYANVYMGREDTRVEYRIDQGEWTPMARVARADPRLSRENALDDAAGTLRGYDRSPEAEVSTHLWRGALATDLSIGAHRIEVRAFDPWLGESRAHTEYRLQEAVR